MRSITTVFVGVSMLLPGCINSESTCEYFRWKPSTPMPDKAFRACTKECEKGDQSACSRVEGWTKDAEDYVFEKASRKARQVVSDDQFVTHIYENMLGRSPSAQERAAKIAAIQSATRPVAWRNILNCREFRMRELRLRDRNRVFEGEIRRKYWFAF